MDITRQYADSIIKHTNSSQISRREYDELIQNIAMWRYFNQGRVPNDKTLQTRLAYPPRIATIGK